MGPIDGRFAVARVLGEGGMGEAVLAHDRDRTPVVVKLLHKKHASRPDFLERFRREIRALEKLRHAHIVSLLGSGFCAERGQPYYVMEFSTGVALDVLVRRTPFNMARTLRLTCQVLDGLAFAHEAGIIHRDLKPQNVFVEMPGTLEESARIIDFGLAKHLAGGERTAKPITAPGQMLGTPTYTAPEQLRGEPPVLATDIYSIGCILMELLTGSPPFPEPRLRYLIQKHLRQAPPRLDTRREAPSELVDLLDECLRKAPDERPSAPELRQRLDAIRGRFEASTARVLAAAGPAPGAGASIADVATRCGLEPADAVRAKLDFTHEKRTERVFLFAGAQLRFGRGTERGGKRTTDLVLRSFPRVGEAGSLASKRSLEVSRWHGTFLVTGEGIAVRDEGPGYDVETVWSSIHTTDATAERGRGLYLIKQYVHTMRANR
ncbi:protein kinase, partial [bacterium]|nr:protein kinase [bacterium]